MILLFNENKQMEIKQTNKQTNKMYLKIMCPQIWVFKECLYTLMASYDFVVHTENINKQNTTNKHQRK